MKMNEYIDRAEQVILHTYNRFPVVMEKGEGVYLYDVTGKNCDRENFNYGKVKWDKERRKYIIILKNGREYQFK